IFTFVQYRQIGCEIAVAHGLHEGKRLVETPLVEVVEKQPAYAPRLLAMFQVKVLVAPFLERGIHGFTKRFTGFSRRIVPVAAILVETIIRSKIVAAPEPPHWFDPRL